MMASTMLDVTRASRHAPSEGQKQDNTAHLYVIHLATIVQTH